MEFVPPTNVFMLPWAFVLLIVAGAIGLAFLLRTGRRRRIDDAAGPQQIHVRRGLAFAGIGIAIGLIGRILHVDSRVVLQHLPVAMVILGGLSALRAFLNPADAMQARDDVDPAESAAAADDGPKDGETVAISKGMGTIRFAAEGKVLRGGSLRLGLGDANVDLADLRVPSGTHVLRTHVGVGNLEIKPPRNLPSRIEAEVGLGDLRLGRQADSGMHNRLTWEAPGYAKAASRLLIRASVSMGSIHSS
jgi:hypothetical protein